MPRHDEQGPKRPDQGFMPPPAVGCARRLAVRRAGRAGQCWIPSSSGPSCAPSATMSWRPGVHSAPAVGAVRKVRGGGLLKITRGGGGRMPLICTPGCVAARPPLSAAAHAHPCPRQRSPVPGPARRLLRARLRAPLHGCPRVEGRARPARRRGSPSTRPTPSSAGPASRPS